MLAAVAIGATLTIALLVRVPIRSRRRRRNDPVFRRSRALAALGRATDMPRVVDQTTRSPEPMHNVELVERTLADRRGHRPRGGRTCVDDAVLARPTIAVLPALPTDRPLTTT